MKITIYKLPLFRFLCQIDSNILGKLLKLQFNLLNIFSSRNDKKKKTS